MTIGSRKMTPPRMLRIVPLGERYISLRPNSSTRASSGVIVAHLTPTPYSLMALAASTVTWSSVSSRLLDAEVEVLQLDVEVRQDQLVLDERPDDPGHLVAVELDDRGLHLDLGHGFLRFGGGGDATQQGAHILRTWPSMRSPDPSRPTRSPTRRRRSRTSTCFSSNVPLVEALEREGAGWARDWCAEIGRVWGGEPLRVGGAGQREPAEAAHARPLRQPDRRGRVPPGLPPAHGPLVAPRRALAAVDARARPTRTSRARRCTSPAARSRPATAARSR